MINTTFRQVNPVIDAAYEAWSKENWQLCNTDQFSFRAGYLAASAALRAQLSAQEAESVRLRSWVNVAIEHMYRDAPMAGSRQMNVIQEGESALTASPRTALLAAVLEAAHVACPPGKYPNTALGAAIDALRAFDAGQEGVNG